MLQLTRGVMLRKGIPSLKSKMRLLILQRKTMKKRRRIVMKIIHQKLKNQVSLHRDKCSWLPNLRRFLQAFEGNNFIIPFRFQSSKSCFILFQIIPRNHWAVRKRVERIGMNWRKKPEKVNFFYFIFWGTNFSILRDYLPDKSNISVKLMWSHSYSFIDQKSKWGLVCICTLEGERFCRLGGSFHLLSPHSRSLAGIVLSDSKIRLFSFQI